ncbi:hypothetical protein BJX61DRAFT_540165 [Aspergillus egyptiacus]|nr:hypothetical protein BJX61DRAFT_540165 [Aspergillus egyptiacus]
MTTTLERSLSRTSSVSMPLSPLISVRHEASTPISESSLSHVHERLSVIDSSLLELRSTVLTKDGYVDRRNREDEHIRREFDASRSISNRIDLNVVALRTDVDQLKSEILQLKSNLGQSNNETALLRSDVDRLSNNVDEFRTDLEHVKTEVRGCRMDISKMQISINELRTELITLRHETSRELKQHSERFSSMEERMERSEACLGRSEARMERSEAAIMDIRAQMKLSERVRFNALAHTATAPIAPVPVVDEEDGSLRWPKYFPRTVWKFWRLKQRSRLHRLIELAEFYKLGDYAYWGSVARPDDSDSDLSECNDPPNFSRAEAVRLFPEAAHQALAVTLGLVYYKIRNEIGDTPLSPVPRAPKRQQEEASMSSGSKQKPIKMARRPNTLSPSALHRLIAGPSFEMKSMTSEESDKLGWNANSEISDDAMSKLRGIVSAEVGTILRALERGQLKMKPSRSERMAMSPTGSHASNDDKPAVKEPEPTCLSTIPTEIVPSSPKKVAAEAQYEPTIPDTCSDTTSTST